MKFEEKLPDSSFYKKVADITTNQKIIEKSLEPQLLRDKIESIKIFKKHLESNSEQSSVLGVLDRLQKSLEKELSFVETLTDMTRGVVKKEIVFHEGDEQREIKENLRQVARGNNSGTGIRVLGDLLESARIAAQEEEDFLEEHYPEETKLLWREINKSKAEFSEN